MNIKSLPLISIGMILVAAIAVSYLISRPALFLRESSMPVFMGEEITVVQKGVEGVRGVEKAVKAQKAIKAERASRVISQPVPQPKVAAPLPILPPSISHRILPEYPVSALEQGLEGTVLLSIYVGMNGSAKKVEVKNSSGVSELDTSAVKAVSQWKFNPAAQGGKAVASWFEFPVRFEVK
jgi:TonB family protein